MRRQKSQGDTPTGDSLAPLKHKRNLLEKEMQERASFIEELQKSGASESKIEDERKKLQELENVAFKVRSCFALNIIYAEEYYHQENLWGLGFQERLDKETKATEH